MTVDGGHRVATYDDLGALAAGVADFVAHSLEQDRPVATITRPALRRAVHERLASLGVDVAQAGRDGFLVTLDAEATMRRFMVGATASCASR